MNRLVRIALDFDSVLSDTMRSWTCKHNQLYGTEFSKSDIKSWEFWEDLNVDVTTKDQCFQEAWRDWQNLPATEPDLDKKVEELSNFGDIDVVTNVDKNHLDYVRNWLENRNIKVQEIKHAGEEKIRLPYNLFIDDSPILAEDAEKNNKKCFVYNQEWNVHIQQSEHVSRIHSLTDAITEISEKRI